MKNTAIAKQVRVRFAPSPTGNLHVGGLRTALFNWLFAKNHGGVFLIRVEDTDRERSKTEYMQSQLASLQWTGIESDEPILIQSERSQVYQEVIETLFAHNKVYRCFCSPEAIEARVRTAGITGDHYRYDGYCRDKNHATSSESFVVRVAVPQSIENITFKDVIRGNVTFEKDQLDDFIIVRSDGSPTYNFTVVVDDAYSRISHIIRGEDHISNTPKQILLYQACGYPVPEFAHIPMILGPEGNRLSKRDGAVDVLSYRQEGYLPDALVNYMIRLGWSHGDQEIFTRQEMIKYFSLSHVGKKAAIFDYTKLEWVNGVYMQAAQTQDLLHILISSVDHDFYAKVQQWSNKEVLKAIEMYKERVKTLKMLAQVITQLYDGPSEYQQEAIKTWMTSIAYGLLDKLIMLLEDVPFTQEDLKEITNAFCKQHAIKLVTIAQPVRIALTGSITSPGIFELLTLLGKHESLKRLKAFQRFLENR